MDKAIKFKAKNKNGELVEYEVVCTTSIEGKSYMCYTDNTKDQDGEFKIFLSGYKKENDSIELFPIEDEEEWKRVTNCLNGQI